MTSNSASILKRPDSEISASSSPTPTQGGLGSFFNNAKQTQINGGSFVNNVVYRIQTTNKAIWFLLLCGILQLASTHLHEVNEGQQKALSSILEPMTRRPREQLKILDDRVAVNAILNDGGRAEDPKCYPGTRQEVIHNIEWWIDSGANHSRMFWLSGPAGGGKTAIVKTILERSKARGVHTINFFFFRADHTRNGPWSFVATLLYQILQHYPATYDTVASILAADPRLLDASIRTQLRKLLYPLFHIIRESSADGTPTVLLIDGLDECDVNADAKRAQDDILRALGSLVSQTDSPFIALVASRHEPQLEMTFNLLPLNPSHIFLDGQYRPAKDIRHFVTEKFNLIKQTHPKAQQLPKNWPSSSDVNRIVAKSSGQFIYAATVMRVLESAFTVPTLSLERLQGIQASTGKMSPFAELDAVYAHILGQTEDWEATRDILSAKLLDDDMLQILKIGDVVYTAIRITCGGEVYLKPMAQHTVNADSLRLLTNDDACTTEDAGGLPIFRIPPVKEFLAAYHSKYTEVMVESAMSYLTALARFQGGDLVFYHASLSEFLSDPSRPVSFYINLEEFSKRVLPALWASKLTLPSKIFAELSSSHGPVAWQLLRRIRQTTPAITQAMLMAHTPEWSMSMNPFDEIIFAGLLADISRLYYPHDIKSYKQILRKWCIWVDGQNYTQGAVDQEVRVPFLQTYLLLAKIERSLTLPNWSTLDSRMYIVYPPTGDSFLDTFLSFLAMIEHQTRRIFAGIKNPWTAIAVSIFIMAVTRIVTRIKKRVKRRLSRPSHYSMACL